MKKVEVTAGGTHPLDQMSRPQGPQGPAEPVSRHRQRRFVETLWHRLVFERSVFALYDGVLRSPRQRWAFAGGPTRAELEGIRDDEHRHALLVGEVLAGVRGAEVAAGPATPPFGLVLGEQNTARRFLHTALALELSDADGWTALIDLAGDLGRPDLVNRFVEAALAEEGHRALLGRWLDACHPVGSALDADEP